MRQFFKGFIEVEQTTPKPDLDWSLCYLKILWLFGSGFPLALLYFIYKVKGSNPKEEIMAFSRP